LVAAHSIYSMSNKNVEKAEKAEKEKPINQTQPTFGEKTDENVDNWIFTTDLNLEAANIPNRDKIKIASGYLRDNALQEATNNTHLDRNEFKRCLKQRFQKANYQGDKLKKLMRIRQKGSVEQYILVCSECWLPLG
jgi:hypothetical protein